MIKIGVDIGHGTNSFPPSKGVYKNGDAYEEHDFNSKLGKRVAELLKINNFDVAMAQHPFSLEVPLGERDDIYIDENVDLVVSLHANWNKSSLANGTCAFYWYDDEKAQDAADCVISEVIIDGDETHGNGFHASKLGSWTNLFITRVLPMTSILIENGFMSGSRDFDLIFGSKQAEFVERRARAIVRGICKHYNKSFKLSDTVKPSSSNKVYYRVQVGAFKDVSGVAKYADEVERRTKFNTYVTEVDGWLKVQVGAFSKKENADKRLSALQSADYKDAFITTKSGKAVDLTEPYNDPIDKAPVKSDRELAQEVINGKHGVGAERKKSLGDRFESVQKIVNEIYMKPKKSIDQLAQEVIDGKHGNGAARKASLGADYIMVQKRVEELLRPNRKSNKEVAQEVIDGKWGNNPDRRQKLEKTGYSYKEVQNEVNKLLK